MGARQPICPLCGQKVKAGERHITAFVSYVGKAGKVVREEEVRHTTPCPK